jgi:phosphate transport system permease protein
MRKLIDKIVFSICSISTAIVLAILFIIIVYILLNGIFSINLAFFTSLPKPVGEEGGGMANAIVGSAIMVFIASLISIPISIGAAIYLAEFGKGYLATSVRFLVDVLAGVPSIVIGIFIYTLVVLPMKRFSAIAGALALAMIMIPTIVRATEEAIRLVPQTLREAGLALGAPYWRVTLEIVLVSARKAIISGVLLSIARIAGETAPLLFTALGNRFFVTVLDRPMSSLPVQIYSYAVSPYEDWHRQAWAATFLLVMFILVVNMSVRLFTRAKD